MLNSVIRQSPSGNDSRFLSLDAMRAPNGLIASFMQPVPSKRALLRWFRLIGLAKIKANPAAHRGGGAVYFHRGAVERALKSRLGTGYKDGTEATV